MTSTTRHWTILGNGAIGHLLACRFTESKIPVTLISRTSPLTTKTEVAYHFKDEVKTYLLNVQSAANSKSVEHLILAVKAQQVETAINDIKPALTPTSKIFLLQNGMGTLEKVTELLRDIIDPKQIVPGTNTHGVYLSKNATGIIEVNHAGFGNIKMGNNYLEANDPLQPNSIDDLKEIALDVTWVKDIERRLWLKLAINAAINPLTAIYHCLNGELLHTAKMKQQVVSLCNESSDLFNKIGINIHREQLLQEVFEVITKTADNQSSMLQDTISGKTTEIDAITGYLLKISNEQHYSMPEHEKIYEGVINLRN